MRNLEIDNRGNVAVVMALVSMAIVLMVSSVVLGKFTAISTVVFPGVVNSTGYADPTNANYVPYQAIMNISSLTSNAMTITSIGLLVLAALGILQYFGVGFGGGNRGGRGKRK
jgi:hypothetical protein